MTDARPGGPETPSPPHELRRILGRVKRFFARVLDRLMHPFRRARARSRLRSVPEPRSVLFLCLGNVCRSPYAEARFRELLGDSVVARSAGFIGPGRAPPDDALEAARRRGLDTSEHRSRLVTPSLVLETDVIVVMDGRQLRDVKRLSPSHHSAAVVLGDLDPDPITRRRIRDPWGQEGDVFDAVFARIDRCVKEVVAQLDFAHGRPAPRSAGRHVTSTDNEPREWSATISP